MAIRYGASAYKNDGSSSANAAPSATAIKIANPSALNGVYWINLPNVGPTQIYCLMDNVYNGGGWMMMMKATTGTTFNYDANYWTSSNNLNPSAYNRNNGDAKFDTMNYFPAKDMMAIWPDITTGTGGSITDTGEWIWLENNFSDGARITPINFFTNAGTFAGSAPTGPYGGKFIRDAKTFSGWASGIFSSQAEDIHKMNDKYLKHAYSLSTSSFVDVSNFANNVYTNAVKLENNEISIQQFNDGVYISVPENLSKEETLERNSINYIKRTIITGSLSS